MSWLNCRVGDHFRWIYHYKPLFILVIQPLVNIKTQISTSVHQELVVYYIYTWAEIRLSTSEHWPSFSTGYDTNWLCKKIIMNRNRKRIHNIFHVFLYSVHCVYIQSVFTYIFMSEAPYKLYMLLLLYTRVRYNSFILCLNVNPDHQSCIKQSVQFNRIPPINTYSRSEQVVPHLGAISC